MFVNRFFARFTGASAAELLWPQPTFFSSSYSSEKWNSESRLIWATCSAKSSIRTGRLKVDVLKTIISKKAYEILLLEVCITVWRGVRCIDPDGNRSSRWSTPVRSRRERHLKYWWFSYVARLIFQVVATTVIHRNSTVLPECILPIRNSETTYLRWWKLGAKLLAEADVAATAWAGGCCESRPSLARQSAEIRRFWLNL